MGHRPYHIAGIADIAGGGLDLDGGSGMTVLIVEEEARYGLHIRFGGARHVHHPGLEEWHHPQLRRPREENLLR